MEKIALKNPQEQMLSAVNNTLMEYVKKELENESSGHDWWHTSRVLQAAIHIGEKENANLNVVKLAALLHDLADYKQHDGDEEIGPKVAREWLIKQNIDEETITHVCQIIGTMSFKGAGASVKMKTKEGMVVQDADRLDAIGAIGVARAFMFAGSKGLKMHDPEIKPDSNPTAKEYKNFNRPSYTQINHFYEKLLLLKDLMNTETGREMAEDRHKFMQEFLDRFFKEWNGEK